VLPRVRPAEPGGREAEFVKVGRAIPDIELRITVGGNAVGERVVGHVEIRGASVTAGYYRNPAETAVLAEHGLQPGRYALAVGTQAAHKNLAALQGAASLLEQHGMTLALAGARDASVFRAAGASAARPLGRVSDAALRALYENALCLLFPSRYEGFGLPPLEAMWCGCPVIAGRAGALPEVLGDAALWFAPDDPAGLASQLATLIAEPARRQRMADAGRARAQHYSWPAAAARLLQLAQDA
jgi:glycosyltransferase involved in cell wall biosynthesis